MKIKTKSNYTSVKTLNRIKQIAKHTKNSAKEIRAYSEELQNTNSRSQNEYAGDKVSVTEHRAINNAIYTTEKIGNWGLKNTKNNIAKWKSRASKFKISKNTKTLKNRITAPKIKTRKALQNTQKTAKATLKTSQKAMLLLKRTARAAIRGAKVAVKATIAATKAVIAGTKALISAIIAGGWVAVLIILIICVVAIVATSVYGIFVPVENENSMTLERDFLNIQAEYLEEVEELKSQYIYDFVIYQGTPADYKTTLAVYAVKLGLNKENPQELITFDEQKAEELHRIYREINTTTSYLEYRTEFQKQTQKNENGTTTITEEKTIKAYLYIVFEPLSVEEICEKYEFSKEKKQTLQELINML